MIPSKDEQVPEHEQLPAASPSRAPDGVQAAVTPEAPGGANLDKVRDILFGNHLRDIERRFARLEERLLKETTDLKADVKNRLGALERYVREEAESLAGQIKAEQEGRIDANGSLSRELKDTGAALDRRLTGLDEQSLKRQRELRQQMLEQYQRLSDDLRQKVDEVLAALAREAGELRADKADRATLASLLTEMAMRLTNDLHVPDAESIGNA
jgi:hypothetical protein